MRRLQLWITYIVVQNERRYGKSEFHFTSSQSISYDIVEATATFIRQRIAQDPTLGIICGSGLGKKELTICPDSPIYKTFFSWKMLSIFQPSWLI